jgi:osmoprotectant transport system ATP-binding protein
VIELDRVAKRYDGKAVVEDVSLEVGRGELFVLIGPSGSGKSTLLRLVNRLIPLSAGTIRLGGEDVLGVRPEALRRRIGYVIQSVGLFPHWTVARNVGAVPELLGWPRPRIVARVDELLGLLGLDPTAVREKYPHQLSGGQQQRVGVARALAADPDVLLMDEPFGALDPITREGLQEELVRLQRTSGKTILFVTHDMEEALRLGARIGVMEAGRLVQVGTPLELLVRPASDFVGRLVGGGERGLRLLAAETVASRLRAGDRAEGEPIAATSSLRAALSEMAARGADILPVADRDGSIAGTIRLADLVRR